MTNELDLTNDNLLGDEFSNAGGLKGFFSKRKEKRKKRFGNFKKKVKKLKDKAGKMGKAFRNRFRAILRKGILRHIKHNAHGIATRLYPAIASSSEIKSKRYKLAFAEKAKIVYAQLVEKWKSLGGNEADLKSAINEGHSKGFLKLKHKSVTGNNSDDFYSEATPDVNIFYGDDGTETSTQEGVVNESEGVEEVPDQEEQKKGLSGFFAWLKGLFHKNGADENPYESGTTDASSFQTDVKADAGNEPNDSEANNDVMKELSDTASTDDAGGSTDSDKGAETKSPEEGGVTDEESGDGNTIMGINKTAFYIGVGVLALVGGYLIYRKVKGNK